MKYFYDTEFLDTGGFIHLISIGIVAEDGREYYAVNSDFPKRDVGRNDWLMQNVVPHLPLVRDRKPFKVNGVGWQWDLDTTSILVKPRWVIANEVREFILNSTSGIVLPSDQEPVEHELWAYYSAYDHVALAQLWGPMSKLPEGIPMWTHDLMQIWENRGRPEKPVQVVDEHHALADAHWNRDFYTMLHVAAKENADD